MFKLFPNAFSALICDSKLRALNSIPNFEHIKDNRMSH